MLELCGAMVVAATEDDDRSLVELARLIGFSNIESATVFDPDVAFRPVVFFLVHVAMPDSAKRSLLEQLRKSGTDRLRYAPAIILTPDGPAETVLRHVDLGFDDVIIIPERRDVLTGRLSKQLTSPPTYIRTSEYLGPDRRRMEKPGDPGDPRREGGHPFSRLTIKRDPLIGNMVARREIFGGSGPADVARV
jgi:CheY-like chemotaxis protein